MKKTKNEGRGVINGMVSISLNIAALVFLIIFLISAFTIYTDKATNILVAQIISIVGIAGFLGINYLKFKKGMKVIGTKDESTSPLGIISGQALGFTGLALFLFKYYLLGFLVLACGIILFSYIKFNIQGVIKSLPNTDPAVVKRRFVWSVIAAVIIGIVASTYINSIVTVLVVSIVVGFTQLGMMSFSNNFESIEKHLSDGATEDDWRRAKEEESLIFRSGANPMTNSSMNEALRKDGESFSIKAVYFPLKLIASLFIGLVVVIPYIKVLKSSKRNEACTDTDT